MFDNNETLEMALARNVRDALYEDLGRGDWTARLVPEPAVANAQVVAKEAATLCGTAWFDACLHALDADATVTWRFADGDEVAAAKA